MKVSIVTPTYNRKRVIKKSIDSSLNLINNNYADEVIIVDDASTDDTEQYIKKMYNDELSQGIIIYNKLNINIGVTGAKNKGVELSTGNWIVFMDSDDYFLEITGQKFYDELVLKNDYDLLFFRCVDNDTNELIGPLREAYELTFEEMINFGTPGECLPVIKRKAIINFPYHTDLRGCESLSYYDMFYDNCKAYVSDIVVRGYDASGEDRLSLKSAIIKRAGKMIKYNYRTLKYWKSMNIKTLFGKISRIVYYGYFKARY
jgi:glycosyltransferase involved in cell wall biosynthesis